MAIARVALPVATEAAFDYWIPDGLAVDRGALGARSTRGPRALTGVVVDVAPESEVPREKLQPIVELRSDVPALPADVLELARLRRHVLPGAAGSRARADAAAACCGRRDRRPRGRWRIGPRDDASAAGALAVRPPCL